MKENELNWITNFIWGIADDVLRDVNVDRVEKPVRQGAGSTQPVQGIAACQRNELLADLDLGEQPISAAPPARRRLTPLPHAHSAGSSRSAAAMARALKS